jgi:tetratricopeptide (TPR) repeat protein
MAKIGRNDPCPCGSGKKYKKWVWPVTRPLPVPRVPLSRPRCRRAGRLWPAIFELTEASNAVVDLVQAGNLDAAEQGARDLLARFPDVHDGYDRLGMVCEARGDHRQAADCYRKAIDVIRSQPDACDPAFEAVYQKLIDRLEPKADTAAD